MSVDLPEDPDSILFGIGSLSEWSTEEAAAYEAALAVLDFRIGATGDAAERRRLRNQRASLRWDDHGQIKEILG